jgi:hypothetical protein
MSVTFGSRQKLVRFPLMDVLDRDGIRQELHVTHNQATARDVSHMITFLLSK